MTRPLLNVLVIVALCGCATAVHIPGEGLVSKPMDYGEIKRLLEKEAQVPEVRDVNFERDSTGSKLFLGFSFWLNKERSYRTAIVTGAGIIIVQGFPIVSYDDQAKPIVRLEGSVGRYDDEGRLFWDNDDAHFIFKDGPVVPYKALSGFKNVTGGDCMIVKFTGESVWVVSKFANPRQALLELPTDFYLPECACSIGLELIIFGRSKLPHRDDGVSCLIYHQSPLGYRLSEEIPIPWARKVYDMNAGSGDALLVGKAQMFAGYYRFNIRTKHRSRVGFAPSDNVLFLKEDVIRTLDVAIRNSR